MTANPKPETGPRLKALRIAAGFATLRTLSEATGIKENALRNYESHRGVPRDDKVRKTLADALGLTRDALGAYLEDRGDAEVAAKAVIAAAKAAMTPLPPGKLPTGPLLRNHLEWADLCARAMRADDKIEPEDLKAIGLTPFLYGPLSSVTVQDVVDLARIHRRMRGRP